MNRTLLNACNGNSAISFAERPNLEFHISAKEIGRGASCIVYHAIASDNTEHLLKEYYPKHLDLSRDSSGRIVVPVSKADAYEQGLVRFRNGCEQQKKIRLSNEGLKNFTCNVQGYYRANGTEYIDMTCFNGQTYDHIQEKSVYNLMLRMRTLAQVVGNYHKAGLLHLDIKPENVYVRPEGETIEDVMLFDFDSVTPISELGDRKALSCTKTWAAPEQLLPEKRRSICYATDLFAIGEIIFVQLFGRHSTNAEHRSFVTGYPYDHKAKIFHGMNPKVFPLLDDLLCHTICGVVDKRYQSTKELLSAIDGIINICASSEPYLVSNYENKCENRATLRYIENTHKQLDNTGRCFKKYLHASNIHTFTQKYVGRYHAKYDTVIVLDCQNGLTNAVEKLPIVNFLPEVRPGTKSVVEQIFDVLDRLCNDRVLLVLENFHEGLLVDDEFFDVCEVLHICQRLSSLPTNILTVGRCDTERFQTIHWQYYYNLLIGLANHHYNQSDYLPAKQYAQKAKNAAQHCDDGYLLVGECIRLLHEIKAGYEWSMYPKIDEEEMLLDEILFDYRKATVSYGQR